MWWLVRCVQSVWKDAYTNTTVYNVAVKDGQDSGQSEPHVHVHILSCSNNNKGDNEFSGEHNNDKNI